MSQRLPAVRPREVLRLCSEQASLFTTPQAVTISSSTPPSHNRVTLAYHNRDLKRRTLESIIEQAGLTHDEFIDLL